MFARADRAVAGEFGGLYVADLVGDRLAGVCMLAIAGPLLLVGVVREAAAAARRRRGAPLHQLLRALLLQLVLLHHRPA